MHDLSSSQQFWGSIEEGSNLSQPPIKQLHLEPPHQDIASYIDLASSDRTDDRKYKLIVGHFVPGTAYKFHKATNGHTFQRKWLIGGFCVAACVIFFQSSSFHSSPGLLVRTPLPFRGHHDSIKKQLQFACIIAVSCSSR